MINVSKLGNKSKNDTLIHFQWDLWKIKMLLKKYLLFKLYNCRYVDTVYIVYCIINLILTLLLLTYIINSLTQNQNVIWDF